MAGRAEEYLVIAGVIAVPGQVAAVADAGGDAFGDLDELVGFPPVTISAAKLPQFQSPLYQALGEAALNAKGWPLIEGWAEDAQIIWDANVKAFLGQMSPKAALDEAAAKIDKSRGM